MRMNQATIWYIVAAALFVLSPARAEQEKLSTNSVDVEVFGMVCSFCAQGIEKKFKAQEEIESLEVRLKDRKVTLRLKPGQTMTHETIERLFKEAGYKATVKP